VPATFSIEETFDVGEDTGSPVIENVYAVPFRNEALQKLTVKVGEDLARGWLFEIPATLLRRKGAKQIEP
jgi:hypothetical protein